MNSKSAKCILCSQDKTKFIGIIKPESWAVGDAEVYDCESCELRFVMVSEAPNYDFIYNQTDTYASMLDFTRKLRRYDDPSWALIGLGHPYYAVLDFLKGKKDLKILDVGCGYGALTYIMAVLGHKVLGTEVSRQAAYMAKGLFGDFFMQGDIKEFKKQLPDERMDLVVAVEVIEHLANPMEFVKDCISVLEEGGNLILTTPNKDYKEIFLGRIEQHKDEIWKMEKPPIHLAIFGEKSMEYIAKENNLKLEIFRDFPGMAQLTGSPNLVAIFTK